MSSSTHLVARLSVFSIATSVFVGCDTSSQSQQVLGDLALASPVVAAVVPAAASPGTTVRVRSQSPVFDKDGSTRVMIGGKAAPIVHRFSDVAVEVLVPNVKQGDSPVQIARRGEDPGDAGQLTVLRAPALKLLLSLSHQGLGLRETGTRGLHPRRSTDPGGRRIQFDVYNNLGRLVYKDVLTHPTKGRIEVFDKPASGEHVMHRLGEQSSAEFSILVPNIPGGGLVQFYDVPDGVVADSPEGRRNRTFIGEIRI